MLIEACLSAGFLSIGVAAGIGVACLLLGILIGRRCRVSNALKEMLEAAKAAVAKAAAAKEEDGGADDDAEAEDNDDDLKAALDELLQDFLSHEWVGGLDDHPDMELNPILMYQVKKAKDELRARKELEAKLIARGLEPNHLETLSPEERKALLIDMKSDTTVKVGANVGSVNGHVRKYGASVNSTAIMVSLGARFTPSVARGKAAKEGDAADAAAVAAKASQEIREKLKTIDGLLQTSYEVDTSKAEGKRSKSLLRAGGGGGLVKNALEMARETKFKPYGGEAFKRQEGMATYAMRGRLRVGPPLDHAIHAQSEKVRRASTGVAGKRAVTEGGRKASTLQAEGVDDGAIAEKIRRASQLLADA